MKKYIASNFADKDLQGEVRLLASSEGVACEDENTVRLLKMKHPPYLPGLSLSDPHRKDDALPAEANEEDIRKALSF